MATLTIRGVAESTRQMLKTRAAQHNRSMEAEVRDILDTAARPEVDFIGDWLNAASSFRNESADGEFEPLSRSLAREINLE